MHELFLWVLFILSAVIWQIGLAYKIFSKNKHYINADPVKISPPKDFQDVFKDKPNYAKVKPPSAVEIDIKKTLKIDKPDITSLKSDEVIKGKVKNKKDQLRKLRNG